MYTKYTDKTEKREMSVLTPIITQTVNDCINVSGRKITTSIVQFLLQNLMVTGVSVLQQFLSSN